MKLLLWLHLELFFGNIQGSGLQEMWIYTPNDGDNDAWDTNTYQYYTQLSDYDLYPQNELNFKFKFAADSLYCGHVMVLLSSAADMQSNNFYELFISIDSNVRRKENGAFTNYPQPRVEPANCIDFRVFNVTWSNQGHIQVVQDGNLLISYTDNTPMTILSVGIKTGFGDKGIWAIQHSETFAELPIKSQVQGRRMRNGTENYDTLNKPVLHGADGYTVMIRTFTGSFCNKPGYYGNMIVLWNGSTKSSIVCATMCSGDNECLGINFKKETNECHLLRTRQLVSSQLADGWLFSAKCLNHMNMCISCL